MVARSPELVLILSADGVIDYASPSSLGLIGTTPARMVGRRLEEFVHPEDLEIAQSFVAVLLATAETTERQVLRMQSLAGHWLHVESVGANWLADPDVAGILVHGRDITDRVAREKRLDHQTRHDSLTGMANRALFGDRLIQALSVSTGHPGAVAVILIDLDRFKSINEALGHEAGDELLRIVSRRLLRATRGSDTVARIGGDEFAVLLTGLREQEDAEPVLQRVESILRQSVRVRDREILTGGSIGVAISDGDGDAVELMRQAEIAMNAAKDGSAPWRFFEPQMQTHLEDSTQLEVDLRAALNAGEIKLAFQPLVELATGQAYGVEALARWDHPVRGPIAPDQFIPLAEKTGFIVPLGSWILHQACRIVSEWQRDGSRDPSFLLSVNFSSVQLVAEGCVADVAEALETSGLASGSLVLELTESALLEDTSIVLQQLSELKALGVQLAIDDFGTGYSSLAYLRSFPIDILKIDRRFINDLDEGGSSAALARAVVGLGSTLSLRTVAEGVETETQRQELQAMGCNFGQGFLFATPLSADEAEVYRGGA